MFSNDCNDQTISECLAKRVVCICDVILKHPLFRNIKREQTHKLSNIADIIDLEDKQMLFFTMQKIDKVFFVLRGQVKLYNLDDNSSKEFIYQFLDQGGSLGLENLYTDLRFYPYAAIATMPSKILTLKAVEFKEVIEGDSIIKNNFIEYLSKLSLDLYSRSKRFVLSSVAERLVDYLEYQAALKSSRKFELNLSKTDLANYLGTISSTLSRAFKELEANNIISVNKTIITLH
jgi:CRP-like cAMP-binding protein